MAEAGVPDFQVVIWHGLSGPAKMPRPIVDRLSAALKAALIKPEVVERLKSFGVDGVGSSPEEYQALVSKELVLWATVARQAAAAGK
jgi:tripartite-type tricarboxylate transporter receptor subunit TctC